MVVGPVAHGGHVVARLAIEAATPDADPTEAAEAAEVAEAQTRVVFVRHALPGERVTVEITEGGDGDRFWRADAVDVLEASPDRVQPPCPFSGPGRCGGCDFQHVAVPAQRDLKAAVVREQLVRLARLEAADPLLAALEVEAVPGDVDGLRWRTRQRYVGPGKGMRKYRSHEVIPVDDCRIARLDAREPAPGTVTEVVEAGGARHAFAVAADGFWQVHPGAPTALVEAVLEALEPQPGESVLDLYAGVGLFAAFLADRVGAAARLVAIEGDPAASAYARTNVPGAEVAAGDVSAVLESYLGTFDLVVLDPPREGARRPVVEAVVARRPRAVAYVACDPAALARDVAIFAEHGYRLTGLRAFDLFPMTHHVECVAVLTKSD
ncbi:methyltransferase [Nocardioides sp. BP30]|uniref:class I SAM-dependent RNA methyltransferase n=1 Tax=Nocardioides sp. BP30 TaxID=3036374 RepID=UPI002468AB05|nr:methyltransferase [Nocardioides sp. BP30]WGL54196.1 methyltransferase [Nocardioides sp. BP30]